MSECIIRPVSGAELEADPHPYCELMIDAVSNGASVGFLLPIDPLEILAYWDEVRKALYHETTVLLGAFVDGHLLGTVQLVLAQRANGSHRAEVSKLLVNSTIRKRGLGSALMEAIESTAKELGRTLLVLDTRQGDPSDTLYRKLGYTPAGAIPGYARSTTGDLHTTIFFYKQLS